MSAMQGRTVAVSTFFEGGKLRPIDADAEEYLLKSGIQRVLVGHKPWGDSPTVIRTEWHDTKQTAGVAPVSLPKPIGVELIDADTSFSDTTKPDKRGCAVSAVLIRGKSLHDNYTHIRGVLKDGMKIDFCLPPPLRAGVTNEAVTSTTYDVGVEMDTLIGRKTPDGWWVKAKLAVAQGDHHHQQAEEDQQYLLSRGEGREVFYSYVTRKDLQHAFSSL